VPRDRLQQRLRAGLLDRHRTPPKRHGKISSMPRPKVKAIGAEQAQRSPAPASAHGGRRRPPERGCRGDSGCSPSVCRWCRT
jgi:hypothetical protein